ncbi:MAG TPA: hypothetical protein PLY32_05670 [Salinivirgaceae bacterium]|nr:hypothetical protein [Salinivirgaceae bacterium]HQA76590.1 hypothetical protein [Salinivirgaceae bacterium]
MIKFLIFLPLFALLSCGGGQTNSKEQTTEQTTELSEAETQSAQPALYQFAISNKVGSKFLVRLEEESSEIDSFNELKFAIHNGKIYRIKLISKQPRDEENDIYRESYENFDNLCGAIFENLDGNILPPDANEYAAVWETILLVNQSFLDENKHLSFRRLEGVGEASENTINALEKQFGRKVMNIQKVIAYGENGQNSFFSVQFENMGDQALGVYMSETADGKRAYAEFPAKIEGNRGFSLSVWHVDDEGQFMPPDISAVFQHGESYIFLINDLAAESTTTFFIRQSGDKLIVDKESEYSRYTSPF